MWKSHCLADSIHSITHLTGVKNENIYHNLNFTCTIGFSAASSENSPYPKEAPIDFLKDNIRLIQTKGKTVFDLTSGEGRNAVYLAEQGFDVTGIDRSAEAIEKARKLAEKRRVSVHWIQADREHFFIPENSADVIVISYYLQRSLFPQIKKALKPGGYLVIETYDRDHLNYHADFPPEFTLNRNELTKTFSDLKITNYQYKDKKQRVTDSIMAAKPLA
ncbi:class I SAM-dependent methyltransferase [Legionella israelensis]|uniref:class I SAM-dependent methyltransferase n=1 Tax=Legionella israelensis TaxID=454 RepID=UPI00142F46ED|nr:class I SAM-dependent methyltransferase [Legionella israelensis]